MGWLKNLLAKMIGKSIAKEIGATEEAKMDGTKKWYQSKTILGGIYATLRGLYTLVGEVLLPALGKPGLPPIPPLVDSIVGSAVGSVVVYGRLTAEKQIG